MQALREFLRPEFLNRIDAVISFNRLTEDNFLGITDIMLQELKESLASRGLSFTWEELVRTYLVKKAYSATYGARNLRRVIQRELEDPISEKIIDSFESPISTLHASMQEDGIQISAE